MLPKQPIPWAAAAAAVLLALSSAQQGKSDDSTLQLDFQKSELPPGWQISPKSWKIEGGELRGEGGGTLDRVVPVSGDFTITFDGWTEEKGSFEVKILDAKGEKEYYTFAYGGRYHQVLKGPKCCILKEDRFVAVDDKMWIFPGRMFHFEVRGVKHQFQMFLNQELGPVFVDAAPPDDESYRIRIVSGTDGKKDKIRIDNVKIELRK
ncbi:MAG: hypothetical protein HY286_04320 [Planctomycetes bacterium]|nr:hypothetical protein [Planctomycetota bacterium]